jgi:AAA domain
MLHTPKLVSVQDVYAAREAEFNKRRDVERSKEQQGITNIQRETKLDRERASWLYWWRRGDGLPDHQQVFCEKFQERLATVMADRALGKRDDSGHDFDRRVEDVAARNKRHESERAPDPPAEPPSDLGEWDAGDDPGPIPPRQWLLGNQFCRGFISSVVAAGGAGKSALRLLQFISMAIGRPLAGQHVFRRCRVLLISLEDNGDELQRRIKAVLNHYNIDRAELKGWLFCASPKLAKLAETKNRTRTIGPLEQQVREAIERRKPDIVSLDPFIKTHSLEENDSGDMDFVCDLLARIAVEFNVAVDSPHHVHKGQIVPGDADSGRGSSGIRDAGRLAYTLATMSEAEAKAFNIEPDDRCGFIRLDPAKVNIAARAAKAAWFRLVGEPIGNGSAEYPNGDIVQVVEPWSPPETWAGLDSDLLNFILSTIDAGMPDGNYYTATNSATDRAAWKVVQRFAPDKSEAQAREVISAWLKTGLLVKFDYTSPTTRQEVKGLKVDDEKRPT